MSPQHHPADEILAAYAAGTLEPGFGLVAGAHVEGCAHCRARVRAFEAVSGASLERLPQTDVASDALTKVMARIEAAPVAQPEAAPDRRPLLERLPLKSRKWIMPGVWVAAVDTPRDAENRVYVLSVAPGRPTARHQHSGLEFCTVLKGAFRDEHGVFAAGDFAATCGDDNHQPVIEGEEECVCLFATEGRLKADGLLGRLAFGYADV